MNAILRMQKKLRRYRMYKRAELNSIKTSTLRLVLLCTKEPPITPNLTLVKTHYIGSMYSLTHSLMSHRNLNSDRWIQNLEC